MGSRGYPEDNILTAAAAYRGVPRIKQESRVVQLRRGLRPEEWAVSLIEAFVHFMMMRRYADSQDEVTSAQRKTRFRHEWR